MVVDSQVCYIDIFSFNFMIIFLFVFRFNVLTRGSLYRKLLAYSDSVLLVNGYLVRKVSTKLDKELEKGKCFS